jgi:hypothetical protein
VPETQRPKNFGEYLLPKVKVEVSKVGCLQAERESNGQDGARAGASDKVKPVRKRKRVAGQ